MLLLLSVGLTLPVGWDVLLGPRLEAARAVATELRCAAGELLPSPPQLGVASPLEAAVGVPESTGGAELAPVLEGAPGLFEPLKDGDPLPEPPSERGGVGEGVSLPAEAVGCREALAEAAATLLGALLGDAPGEGVPTAEGVPPPRKLREGLAEAPAEALAASARDPLAEKDSAREPVYPGAVAVAPGESEGGADAAAKGVEVVPSEAGAERDGRCCDALRAALPLAACEGDARGDAESDEIELAMGGVLPDACRVALICAVAEGGCEAQLLIEEEGAAAPLLLAPPVIVGAMRDGDGSLLPFALPLAEEGEEGDNEALVLLLRDGALVALAEALAEAVSAKPILGVCCTVGVASDAVACAEGSAGALIKPL